MNARCAHQKIFKSYNGNFVWIADSCAAWGMRLMGCDGSAAREEDILALGSM